jgi:hypothetical protein
VNTATSLPATLTVYSAPILRAAPVSQVANEGDEVRFDAVVEGTQPITYKWTKTSGNAVVGLNLTQPTLRVGSFTAAHVGTYRFEAKNSYGSVSTEVSLSEFKVSDAFDSAAEAQVPWPTENEGGVLELPGVIFTPRLGLTFIYQWRRNGVALTEDVRFSVNGGSLKISPVLESDAGQYDVLVRAMSGGVEKGRSVKKNYLVTVRSAPKVSGIFDQFVAAGESLMLSPTVSPAPVNSASVRETDQYKWEFESSSGGRVPVGTSRSLSLENMSAAKSGTYHFTVSREVVVLGIPQGTLVGTKSVKLTMGRSLELKPLPASVLAKPRERVALLASLTDPSREADPTLRYQWRFNGQSIRGATQRTLVLSGVSLENAGSYDVVVSNSVDRVTSSITNLSISQPTRITDFGFVTDKPGEGYVGMATVNPGQKVQLQVAFSGDAPVSYQWIQGNARTAKVIPNVTSGTYSIDKVSIAEHEGWYMVVVKTARGNLSTKRVELSVNAPVRITTPASQVVNSMPGKPVKLQVRAEGTGPLLYTWTRDGEPISGGVSPVYAGNFTAGDVVVRGVENWKTLRIGMLVTSAALPDGGGYLVTRVDNGEVRLSGAASKTVTGAVFSVALNTIDLPSVSQADAGTYQVVVSNSVPSSARSTLEVNVTKPVTILSDPVDARLRAAVSFSGTLTAGGSALIVPALEARGIVEGMVVKNVSTSVEIGRVDVVKTASGGTVTLALNKAASVAAKGVKLVAGTVAEFSVAVDTSVEVDADKGVSYSYQWRRNGVALNTPESRRSKFTIAYPTLQDSAWYDVEVWNSKGGKEVSRIVSASAQLEMFEAPRISNVTMLGGGTLEVSALGTGPLDYQWEQLDSSLSVTGTVGAGVLYPTNGELTAGSYRLTVRGPFAASGSEWPGDKDSRDIVVSGSLLSVFKEGGLSPAGLPDKVYGVVNGGSLFLDAKPLDGYTFNRWEKWPSVDARTVGTSRLLSFIPKSLSDGGYYYAVYKTNDEARTEFYSKLVLVTVNPAHVLYGTDPSQQLRNSLASQQQMIVGEGKTAAFRVNPAVAGLDMYWEFNRSLKFWGDAVSAGTSELRVRGKDAVYLEALLGGTSEAALGILAGMRVSTVEGSPVSISGGSIQMGSFNGGTYTLKLNKAATVVGSGTSISLQAVASTPQVVKQGSAYEGTPARYSVLDPEVFSIRAASMLDEGTYTAVVKVPVGSENAFVIHRSEPWVLTVNALPLITEHPVVYAKFPGDKATMSVGGFFSPETKFTWYVRYTGETSWLPLLSGADPRTHVINNVQIADEGEYQLEATNSVGTVVSNGTFMAVERPAFLTLYAAEISDGTVGVFPGRELKLNVAVTGSLSGLGEVTFQKLQPGNKWGNLNSGATHVISGTECSVAVVGEEQEGYYRVSATGRVNGVVYSNVVRVDVHDPITFTSTKIASVVATAGESFTLTAPAKGYAPQYQWFLNGIAIPGGILASYTGTAARESAGAYSVEVSNKTPGNAAFSSATLVVAQVSVNDKPSVDSGMISRNVEVLDEDSKLILTATLSGTPGEVRYQWRKDGKPLSGSGVSGVAYVPTTVGGTVEVRYEKAGINSADQGYYDLIATNAFGVSTGLPTQVDVFAKPSLIGSPSVQDVLAVQGDDAVFRVNAVGSGTLIYHWYATNSGTHEANAVPDDAANSGTMNALRLTATSDLNGTKYYVKVTNHSATGTYSTFSNVATLKVAPRSALVSVGTVTLNNVNTSGVAALSLAGFNTLRATATSIDPGSLKLSYQWRRNGEKIASGFVAASGIVSPGTSKFALEYRLPAELDSESEAVYDVLVDNGAAVAASPAISVTLDPRILAVEIPNSVNPSDPVKMTASFTGKGASYKYEWYRGATLVKTATASGASPFSVEYGIAAIDNTGTLAAGSYKLRVFDATGAYVESKPVVMAVAKPASIITQPVAPLRVGVGGSFTLRVGAAGDRLKYQWSRDGLALSALQGGTSDALIRSGEKLDGAYQVKVWNEFSMALSSVVNVSVNKDLGVDLIQPGTVDIGGSANLIANASGPGLLSYQWYRAGSPIPGATAETLKISPVTVADGTQYWVKVTSSENTANNSVNSGSVSLSVRDVPRILVAPVSRIVTGTGATSVLFKVVAESRRGRNVPLTYTWTNLATNQTISSGNTLLVSVAPSDQTVTTQYAVTVSSASTGDSQNIVAGSVTRNANLTVLKTGTGLTAQTTAGSDGVSVHTGWWVYWVKATGSDGSSKNGYYALEREYKGGVVTPKRAVWVWEPEDSSVDGATHQKDAWEWSEQSILDAVASERGEFSALGYRATGGDYAIAGRLDEEGEGALYGAPDFVEGVYSDTTGEYTVELSWDMEQVYRMDLYSDFTTVQQALEDALKATLLNND